MASGMTGVCSLSRVVARDCVPGLWDYGHRHRHQLAVGFWLHHDGRQHGNCPFATLPFDRWLLRHHKLEGAWRTTATIDPAPQGFLDRLLRFWVGHPALFFALIVVGIGAMIILLLSVGPPTEWGDSA